MPSLNRLFALTLVALTVNAASIGIVPPSSKGIPDSVDNTLNLNGTQTDSETIENTVGSVNQKGGATDDTPPNQPVGETGVTAIDGQLVNATVSSVAAGEASGTPRSLQQRDSVDARGVPTGYHQIFAGTGPVGTSARDASIQGTAYLTYTVVPNSTYNVNACLDFCTRVKGCVFANLFYEFNNDLLDFVFSEHSNLKCALYGDVHTANEKTNFGGQQAYPAPAPLTYIQASSGWAADSLVDPDTPAGYEPVFGPTNGANNAPGYMGFSFIDRYDVAACAALCSARDPDPNGGACQYFNIWRALVNGVPTTYTCSFYYIPADESTAVNYGQGDLKVTYSRGYKRKDLIADGGFEGYHCDNGSSFCFAEGYSAWAGTSPAGGTFDATVFSYKPYAHSGSGVALLGAAGGLDALPGTLTLASSLTTVAGAKYSLSFFHNSAYSGSLGQKDTFVEILWNGAVVEKITPGYSTWKQYSFQVTGTGNDKLALRGGRAPAWSFIDDVHLYAL